MTDHHEAFEGHVSEARETLTEIRRSLGNSRDTATIDGMAPIYRFVCVRSY